MSVPKIWAYNERVTSADLNGNFDYVNNLIPIGTILAHYDFDGEVGFDEDIFLFCNGQTIDDELSPLDNLTVPDLSNRYLVGFGTEAGGDIGSAAWATTIKGNASHLINLQHSHTETRHTHTENQHRHSILHDHDLTSGFACLAHSGTGDLCWRQKSTSSWAPNGESGCDDVIHPSSISYGIALGGTTDGSNTSNTGYTTPTMQQNDASNTGNNLSSTQSIQPRSVQVRYIMRYK